MDIKDIFGLSKPLIKLLEVISKGVGALSQPYLIKKTADARAYEIKVVAEAIKENQEDLQQINYDKKKISLLSLSNEDIKNQFSLEKRTANRLEFQEQKRQNNIENITQKAAKQLEDETTVSEEPLDDDWISRFFNYAQDISNDELQNLWAQILAGEVKQPKTYSLRTLQLLRNLSKSEAEIFTKVSNYAIKYGNDHFLLEDDLEKHGITFNELSLLSELGLIHAGSFIGLNLKSGVKPTKNPFIFGNILVVLEKAENSGDTTISIKPFTSIGKELLKMVKIKPDFTYVQRFATKLRNEKQKLLYGHVLEIDPKGIKHTNPLMEIPKLDEKDR